MSNDKTTQICIIAAGMRANPNTMYEAHIAAERDTMDSQDVIAMWATTQFEFIEKHVNILDQERSE